MISVKLGEVAEINPKLRSRPASVDAVSFIGMADVSAEAAATSEGVERPFGEVSKGYTLFEDTDLLLAKITPCFENGKIAQARLKHRVGAGSTEFHVIRPRPELLDPRYALHFLRRAEVRESGRRRMTGAGGQRRVPAEFLSNLEMPVLVLEEQRRIADVLDRADALRTKCRLTLALLDDLTRSIFLDIFGDPVMNERGWPTGRLGELGHLDRGVSKHRPRNSPELLGGPYPFVQTGDVANSGGYITAHGSSYSVRGLAQSKLWPAGTLCITIAANIAKTGVLTYEACFPDSVVGFDSDPATTSYVQVWLSFLQKTLEESAPESAQKNINLAILRNLQVPTPPLEFRKLFDNRRRAVETLKNLQSRRLAMLEVMVEALRARAFRGEL